MEFLSLRMRGSSKARSLLWCRLLQVVKLNPRNLKSLNSEVSESEWRKVEEVLKEEPKRLQDIRFYLRSLLWSRVQGVREEAWRHLHVYKELGITGLEKAFSSKSDRIKLTAWQHVREVMELGLLSREQVVGLRQHFWRMLRSYYPTVRKKAWKLLPTLVKLGIVGPRDRERLVEFLRNKKPNIRLMAWNLSKFLVNEGVLTRDDLEQNLIYLKELTERNSTVSLRARKILEEMK
ncbi:MAG: hypothetical protein OWQ52_11320 [Metallosphaera prunae]|uniref:hypothetical protein n=1 Tax=Metallosphaera prunae TaxID=47304 RepID=UPI0022751215|nr:hypothetical protein [Metallosphaera prunae]MCY0862994.1 hypothetical protein [Metallosphaera prunae]